MSRDRVADELEIRNLVARIAHEADMAADLTDYLACFCEDAVWQMPGAPEVQGHAAIRAGAEGRRASGGTGPGSHTRHLITTLAVALDGDRAVGDAYWLFLAETHAVPELRLAGHYRDEFVRTDAGWKLQRRDITID